MKIRATGNLKTRLDLSALEQAGRRDVESDFFRRSIGPGETIEVEDKWYYLATVQGALSEGLIEILEYEPPEPFEVKELGSVTDYLNLKKVQVDFFPDSYADKFDAFNDNFDLLDGFLKSPSRTLETVTSTPYSANLNSIILVDDDFVGGDVTINLPDASNFYRKSFTIKKIGSTGKVIIDGYEDQTIDGEEIFELLEAKEVVEIISDGNNWWII